MCTKRRSNEKPITEIHWIDYNLDTAALITVEGQKVIEEQLKTSLGQLLVKESMAYKLSKLAFNCAYKGTKEMNKVNPKVIELVEKIKSRGHNPGESSAFLKTVKEQGIQFASGNGMTLEELTTFLQESKDNREHAKECAECDLKEWIKEEIISNNIGQHLCEQCSYRG